MIKGPIYRHRAGYRIAVAFLENSSYVLKKKYAIRKIYLVFRMFSSNSVVIKVKCLVKYNNKFL